MRGTTPRAIWQACVMRACGHVLVWANVVETGGRSDAGLSAAVARTTSFVPKGAGSTSNNTRKYGTGRSISALPSRGFVLRAGAECVCVLSSRSPHQARVCMEFAHKIVCFCNLPTARKHVLSHVASTHCGFGWVCTDEGKRASTKQPALLR